MTLRVDRFRMTRNTDGTFVIKIRDESITISAKKAYTLARFLLGDTADEIDQLCEQAEAEHKEPQ